MILDSSITIESGATTRKLRIDFRDYVGRRLENGEVELQISCQTHTAAKWRKDGLAIILQFIVSLREPITNNDVMAALLEPTEEKAITAVTKLIKRRKKVNKEELQEAATHYKYLLGLLDFLEIILAPIPKKKPANPVDKSMSVPKDVKKKKLAIKVTSPKKENTRDKA